MSNNKLYKISDSYIPLYIIIEREVLMQGKEEPYSKFLKDRVWQVCWIGIEFIEG
jgi:hypothetical protein